MSVFPRPSPSKSTGSDKLPAKCILIVSKIMLSTIPIVTKTPASEISLNFSKIYCLVNLVNSTSSSSLLISVMGPDFFPLLRNLILS